jgi:hypothetical protein
MRSHSEHLPAWTFEDAARRTLDPGIFREYKRAQKEWDEFRPSSIRSYAGLGLNGESRYVDSRFEQVLKRRDIAIRNRDDGMINQFVLGKLVTYGREERQLAELKLIPASAWRDMRIHDWKEFRAATRRPKVVIHDVRIYPVLEAPNAIDHLVGVKLMAIVSNLIFSDPLINVLRGCTQGKTLEFDKRRADSHFLWPLVQPIENRNRGLSTASRLANSILRLRVAELIEYLSTAQVMAVGTNNGVVGVMPPTVWTEVGVYLDLNSGAIFRLPAGMKNANVNAIQPFCTDLILSRPDQISPVFHVKPRVSDDARSTTVKARSKPISKAVLTVKMREKQSDACRLWLEDIIGASPMKRTHTKEKLVEMARRKWPGLSKQGVRDLRKETIKKLKAHAWPASGAPEKASTNRSTRDNRRID